MKKQKTFAWNTRSIEQLADKISEISQRYKMSVKCVSHSWRDDGIAISAIVVFESEEEE